LPKQKIKKEIKNDLFGLILLALSLISFTGLMFNEWGGDRLSNQAIGAVGIFIVHTLTSLFGLGKYIFPICLGFLGFKIFQSKPKYKNKIKRLIWGIVIIFLVFLTVLHIPLINQYNMVFGDILRAGYLGRGGGLVGGVIAYILGISFGPVGSYIVLATFIIVSFILINRNSLKKGMQKIGKIFLNSYTAAKKWLENFLFYEVEIEEGDCEGYSNKNLKNNLPIIVEHESSIETAGQEERESNNISAINDKKNFTENDYAGKSEGYILPPLDLFKKPVKAKKNYDDKDLTEKVVLLEQTLASFGVKVKVTRVTCGPVITRFELQPAKGVKVSKIVSLSDDIALSLAAPDVRIEAPIPGKSVVGIEVPNKQISMVYFREIIESKEFNNSKSPLLVALGKDISGSPVVANLKDMPHLLIAGATGSGKSVCMNTLIVSLLFRNKPDVLKLLIIDPKRVELTHYNSVPHLLCPVVTEPKKAATALRWMVREMENRYEKFAVHGVRDIDRYNELAAKNKELEKLHYFVVLIDELADLMMVAPADVEDCICRLAQMARAAGIHLVVATQRPSVDVITGLIKANIPSRIAFAVSSHTDSRTILDLGGAEKLLGRGDMLFYPVGAVKPIRVQGAYISDEEIEAIVRFLKSQGVPEYDRELLDIQKQNAEEDDDNEEDELLSKAVHLCIEQGQASISLLQRRLRIGYTRAARLIDIMEKRGFIGPFEGSKPRSVLINLEQYQRLFPSQNS